MLANLQWLPFYFRPFFKSPYAAAQTIIYACVAPELETVSGKYLRQCAPHWEGKQARSMEVRGLTMEMYGVCLEVLWHF